jgi:hypothetical protein
MPEASATIIDRLDGAPGLARRILDGEVVIVRRGLQQLGVFDTLVQSTLAGIRKCLGPDVASQVERAGFDRIHEFVQPGDIPRVTDAVYEFVTANANDVLV